LCGFILILARPAAASVEGRVAAARVQEESYRHILDDMLYAHAGDDRSIIGPEHDPARANIAMLLESYGLTVTLDPFVYSWPEPNSIYYNVVGTKLGTTYPDQEYIIGAHYDSYCWTSPDPAPGADDDASGVALVLEAARVLSAYDSDYTLRFIAFDREEQWMVGSYAYVEDHLDDDILGMINADMIAFNPGVDIVNIWSSTPSEPLKLALAQAAPGYADLWDPNALVWNVAGQLPFCDHWPFEEAGFEAVSLEEYAFSQNLYYHVPEDNVDSPGYIDYTFATRITRGVVGFLVDSAGVNVDIPDADYDMDGDVDEDDYNVFASCFTGTGIPPEDPDCNFFDLDSDGDVDCVDLDLLAAVWTGPPVDPPAFWACVPQCLPSSPPEPEMIGDKISAKNRFLSIRAGDPGRIQAIRVTAVSLPPPFDVWNGLEWYVGRLRPYCAGAGQGPGVRPDEGSGCGPAPGVYDNGQTWFWGAPLLCDPLSAYSTDWTSLKDYCNSPAQTAYNAHHCDEYCWPGGGSCDVTTSLCDGGDHDGQPCCGGGICGVSPVVHLHHEAIVPSHMASGAGPIDIPAAYDIQVIDSACALSAEEAYSAPLTLTQAGFGDINTDVSTCPNGPPDGSVGVVTDVVGALNKFSNNLCAMQKARVDLVPCRVDFNVGIPDVVAALYAFQGRDYEDWCGTGRCGPLGLCKGGSDHGQACTNDDDCSSDPCTEDLSREIGESRPGFSLPLIDAERDGGLRSAMHR
jgi:hypothetical protein